MISKKTVLVLGAGASCDYGYPTTGKLWENVCNGFTFNDLKKYLRNDTKAYSLDAKLKEFIKRLSASPLRSVDAFLAHNPEYIELGKIAIAHALMEYEKHPSEYSNLSNDFRSKSWYHYLYNEYDAPIDVIKNNQLSIVTFNYDKSLEYFLWNSLESIFGANKCEEIIQEIKIVHVYGKLGYTFWENKERQYYVKGCTPKEIYEACNNINIMPEKREASKEFEMAHNLISNAKQIFFLGFGYDNLNLERLKMIFPRKSGHNEELVVG